MFVLILAFHGCGNQNTKITSELQNFSSQALYPSTTLKPLNGSTFKVSGSLEFLYGRNFLQENFSYFFTLDSLLHVLDYKSAQSAWKVSDQLSTENDRILDDITNYENLLLGARINYKLSDYLKTQELIDQINIKWSENDFISQFYFIEVLIRQAEVWNAIGSYQASLAAISYGLHLTETSSFSTQLIRQKADLFAFKAAVLTNEKGKDFQKYALESSEFALSLFEKLEYTRKANEMNIIVANIFAEQGKMQEGINLLNSLDTSIQDINYLSNLHLNKGYLAYENGKIELAIKSYEKAIQYFKKNDCNTRLEILYDYLFYCYLEKQAETYLQLITELEDCSEDIKTLKSFYNSSSYFELYKAKFSVEKYDANKLKAYEYGMQYRKLANQLFGNQDELHLGDLYVENSSSLISLFEKEKFITKNSSSWELVMQIVFDSKNQFTESQDKISSSHAEAKMPANIVQAITNTNDFKYSDRYSSKDYKTIYDYFLGSTQTKKIIEKRAFKASGKERNVDLFDLEEPHLVFIAHGEICWKIFIDAENNISLEKLSLPILRRLTVNYVESILKKDENRSIKDSLSTMILPTNMQIVNSITIIPDDVLQNLPFAAFLTIPHHLDFWFQNTESIQLSPAKSTLFSYSDEESINGINEKVFVELASGLNEVESLKVLLGSSPKIMKDESFTKEILKENLAQDIIHISSHAVVKAQVRQNCFLALNKKDGAVDTLYVSEINAYNEAPRFMYLSTCNSGIGYTLQGNGKYSLSRSFKEIGTETIISTLWPVDDKVTSVFSRNFYKNWSLGMSAQQAMYETQQAFLKGGEYQDAFYWAGFILEGNGKAYLEN